jgi:hypothetical protein
MNVILHVFRYLIVKDMFLGDNAGLFESEQECVVCPYHLGILALLHGFNGDGVAVNFHHNHDVFFATKRLDGELACLVREHGFAYNVRLGVHITYLLVVEVGSVACFQWCHLNFGVPYVLSCLVQMSICSFYCLRIVLLDIGFSQHQPAHVVCLFGWALWLPKAPLLHQQYLVLSLVISDADEDWFPFACYEDIHFLEYVDALLCED